MLVLSAILLLSGHHIQIKSIFSAILDHCGLLPAYSKVIALHVWVSLRLRFVRCEVRRTRHDKWTYDMSTLWFCVRYTCVIYI